MKCKSCEIDLSKPPKIGKQEFHFPKDIPVSDQMKSTVTEIRRDKDASSSKKRR